MEIWNNVFMEYIRDAEGNLSALPNKNIDTGMGLERITATLNGVKTVYETDAFSDVLLKIKELVGGENYNEK
jgi:alanyl-tRNA synthetase